MKRIPSKDYKGPVYDSDNGYPERSNMNRYENLSEWIMSMYHMRTYDESTDFSRWHIWGGHQVRAFTSAKQIIREAIDNLDLPIYIHDDEVNAKLENSIKEEVESINRKLPLIWEFDREVSIDIDSDLIQSLLDYRKARIEEDESEHQKEIVNFMRSVYPFTEDFKKGVKYDDQFTLKLVPNT